MDASSTLEIASSAAETGKETVEQLQTLVAVGDLRELARHQKIFGGAEQPGLVLGDVDHETRLLVGKVAELADDFVHLARFGITDVLIGMCDASQHVRERSHEARGFHGQVIDGVGDPGHGARGRVIRQG